ncbi:hypothetical protein C3F09_11440 [candidate division GN15 bacterium]|uniref:Uncharacterized protein n=1 Tax=candidate division GN15 bacterium TaxID=2072418 RepID=A0A855WVC5_9BACT|nr:MAG: hypothetical protein C3F09_11440 [candidate division GN15 bacterium]
MLLVVAATCAYATDTRLLTMGENYTVMVDDYNVWMFPSRVNMYPNIGVGEFSRYMDGDGFYQFGVNWKFGETKPWVLGTYFTNDYTAYPSDYLGNSFGLYGVVGDYMYTGLSLNNNRRIDLLYGRKLGTQNFGFGFSYINSGEKQIAANYKNDTKFSHYAFTFGLTPDAGNWDLAASLGIGTWTNKGTLDPGTATAVQVDLTKPDGYLDFMLTGRMFAKYNQTITFVPHASLWLGKHGQKSYYDDNGDTATTKIKSTMFAADLGCGMHYAPVTNVLAVLDFGLQFEKRKGEYTYRGEAGDTTWTVKYRDTYLPYWKLGMEGDVFSWLDVRLGAVSNWHNYKDENVNANYPQWDVQGSDVHTNTYLGLGFNWNRLHIDTYTDPELFLKGFDFISGSDGGEGGGVWMNWQMSVLYEMF